MHYETMKEQEIDEALAIDLGQNRRRSKDRKRRSNMIAANY